MENDKTIEDEVNLTPDTEYWLYNIKNRYWKEILNKEIWEIPCHNHYDICKGDIIFIFVKRKDKKNGFAGVLQASSDMIHNTENKKILNDININKYYIKVDYLQDFKTIKLRSIFDNFCDSNISGFKNRPSFMSKFVKRNKEYSLIQQTKGFQILEALSEEADKDYTVSPCTDDCKNEKESKDIKQETSEEPIEETSEETSEEVNEEDLKKKLLEKEKKYKETNNNIPILLIPCYDFLLPDEEKDIKDYVYNHCITCNNCNITNNSNSNIMNIISNSSFKYIELCDDEKLDIIIDDYHELNNYVLKKPDNCEGSYVEFINIQVHDIYEDTYVICQSV